MTIRLQLPKVTELKPRITVIGIGGAGGNAVNNMIASGLTGVEFVVANTDAQALATSSADLRIQLGANLTEGLGAGSKPEIGQAAAEEAIEEIRAQIAGSHMVFIAAGMGGGTGTGAAAVVARIARDLGILVVAIVTKPFHFEGARRMRLAEAGVAELRRTVDTMIVIPNQNLFRVATERTTFAEAFVLADQVLYSGIACIVDLIVKEGLINLDFADVRTVLAGMGSAVMGTGEASGERRAVLAAEEAISNPLLDDVSLKGARGLLLSITGGRNLTLYEVDEAASRVRKEVDPDANIIVGATFDDSLQDRVRVSIVASGMDQQHGVEVPPLQPPLAQPVRAGAALHAAPVAHAPRDVDQGTTLPRPPAGPARAPLHQPDSGKQPPGATAPLMPHEPQSGYGEPPGLGHAPPRSQPVTATASGARAPSQRDAEDYARAMSDAYAIPTIGAPGSQDGRSDAAPARGAWESSDGVTIEEAMAPLAGAPSPPPLPPQRASRTGAQAADAGFTPQPPADPRRSQRRMPEIADFPEVGQRDYRAKSEDPAGHETSGRRRQGLFERLSSFARRESDDERAAAGRPQTRDDFETAHRDGKAAAGRRNGAAGADRSKSRDAQPPELPDFFDRKRR